MSIFSKVAIKRPKTSKFSLSHQRIFSADWGKLYPCYVEECVPGDKFKIDTASLVRMMPLHTPMMGNIDVRVDFFFVPNRLLWKGWPDFITGGPDGRNNQTPPHFAPSILTDSDRVKQVFTTGNLFDHLGYPSVVMNQGNEQIPSFPEFVSSFPVRAYWKIWNDFYRDENLQEEQPFNFDYSEDSNLRYEIAYRCWRKDYFTSALPFPQRGNDVPMPLNGEIPVSYYGGDSDNPSSLFHAGYLRSGNGTREVNAFNTSTKIPNATLGSGPDGNLVNTKDGQYVRITPGASQRDEVWLNTSNFRSVVDLSDNEGNVANINDLRRSLAVQSWLEKNARAGSRYIEQIFSHFGRRVPDYRLQRAEYLGGSTTPIQISEVLQTSQTSEDSPQANMAGHGVSAGFGGSKPYSVDEHGYIIGIFSIIPKAAYFQGLNRSLQRANKLDYYFPEFAHLGEQAIYNNEIFTYGVPPASQKQTWGYTPRYAEYKFHHSSLHGDMKNNLDFWNIARKFKNAPNLAGEFVSIIPSLNGLNRIFPVEGNPSTDHFYVNMRFDVKCRRPMPRFGTPRLIG